VYLAAPSIVAGNSELCARMVSVCVPVCVHTCMRARLAAPSTVARPFRGQLVNWSIVCVRTCLYLHTCECLCSCVSLRRVVLPQHRPHSTSVLAEHFFWPPAVLPARAPSNSGPGLTALMETNNGTPHTPSGLPALGYAGAMAQCLLAALVPVLGSN